MRLVDQFSNVPLRKASTVLPRRTLRWAEKDLRIWVGSFVALCGLVAFGQWAGMAKEEALFFSASPVLMLYLLTRIEAASIRPSTDKERAEIIARWKVPSLRWPFRYIVSLSICLHWSVAFGSAGLICRAFSNEIAPGLAFDFMTIAFVAAIGSAILATFCLWLHFDRRTFRQWLLDVPGHALRLIGLESSWLRRQFNHNLRFQ